MINLLLSQLAQGGVSLLEKEDISDVEKILLDANGNLQPVPAATLAAIGKDKLRVFCHAHGVYSLPSTELIDAIQSLIPNKESALEIGAGNGVYGRALGITMTDNYMQAVKNARKFRGIVESYAAAGQPLVQYGEDVLELDGNEAVRKYKPETVFMSWVTHKWKQSQHHLGGNMYGVDMDALLRRKHIKRIILVGNKNIHAKSPLMSYPHRDINMPNILFSRATHDYLDRLFVWDFNQ